MNFNYFYNTGSQPFKGLNGDVSQQKLLSFWSGEKFRQFFSHASKKVSDIANYPVEQFFSDSLNYSVSRIKEINQDIALNPVSSTFEKTATSNKFGFKKFLAVGAATMALQMGATAIHNNNAETQFIQNNHFSSLQSQQNKFSTVNNYQDNRLSSISDPHGIKRNQSVLPKENALASFLKQSLSNSNPVENLREDIPKEIVKMPKYMQSMFTTKEDAFVHLLNVAEGKQDKFYRDNKGIALAYGWNPTRNTKEFNLKIAQEAGFDEEQTAAISRISNTNKVNYVPKDLKKMRFTAEQVQKTALALMPHYEQGFLDAMAANSIRNKRNPQKDIQAYHDLPNNQQAIMIHMAYKVGGENLMNYKTFYKKLFGYLDKPTKGNLAEVKKNFQYTYATLDGERLHDTRVEEIHAGFFSDCAINVDPKIKEKVSSKINQCRNIANLTNKDTVEDIKTNVASIQTKMAKMFG